MEYVEPRQQVNILSHKKFEPLGFKVLILWVFGVMVLGFCLKVDPSGFGAGSCFGVMLLKLQVY